MAGPLTEAKATASKPARRASESGAGGRANILIVDDRPDKHIVFKAILDELDQNLIHVDSGEAALKEVLRRDFAVILLDVNMPGVDGFETAALIHGRRRSAHIPIIFITANYGDEARVAQGYALGAVDFMVSPVVPEILRSKVKVFVDLFLLAQLARRQAEESGSLAAERTARAEAEHANRRSAFMANASATLGRSLAVMAASRELPRLAIPFLCDVSAVTLGPDAGIDARTEVAWTEPGSDGTLQTETFTIVECAWWRSAIERVIDTGHGESFDASVAAGADGSMASAREPLQIPRGTPITSLIIVPLIARSRTLGAFSLGLGPSGRAFRPDDVAMATDLANRAAMALDNALLYRTIHEQDRRKNEFLAMLAHELRNPLTPITNALYIMDLQSADGEKLGWAKKVIGRQVRILGRLVDDLLDVSRITQGKITLRIDDVDVAEVVAAAVETARPLIDARQHRFTMTLRETSLRVKGDFARLAQILANLLNNAAKYTEPNGSIWLTVAREGAEIVFSVRDSGMGIPAESLSSVFDLFAQSQRTLDRSQGGLGIGLTLVRRLVEMQGGNVSVRSGGHDRGSEFTVRMPAGKSAEGVVQSVLQAGEPTQQGGPHEGCLLVVDDNRDAAESMAILLRMEGYVVHVAYDGPTAVEAVQSLRPRAVLLDLGLPGIDGFQVAERIRSMPDGARMVLIAISGYGQDEHRRRAQQTGFDQHFVKPIDPVAITRLLDQRRHSEPRPATGNVVAFQKNR